MISELVFYLTKDYFRIIWVLFSWSSDVIPYGKEKNSKTIIKKGHLKFQFAGT